MGSEMECPFCGSDIARDEMYCPECGTDLVEDNKYNF